MTYMSRAPMRDHAFRPAVPYSAVLELIMFPTFPPCRMTGCGANWGALFFILLILSTALLLYVAWTTHDEIFRFRKDQTCEITRYFVWPPDPYTVTLEGVQSAAFEVSTLSELWNVPAYRQSTPALSIESERD
jgi:hypothetical protein